MKCVMIIDKDLPIGIIANTSAALGISLASQIDGLIGKKLEDMDGRVHEGVTNIPIPILALSKEELKNKYDEILEKKDEDIKIIGFSDVAQKSLSYDDYENKLILTGKEQINYLGLCIYGLKKKVNKLTSNFKMLR
ncbi:DUF2000 domain-containing protein [Marinisporobacter balticus]|uniref:DUF2000 family protein n=1 Tax=Marinisporobacter balticus TaxID=2018667 RepID=A0A4R2KER7_9FIRM|nr:DUF2000 domain-containing protein [Marinisporobacter balticus]TCO68799.1 hypothetical protein EV214_1392 [Marinisporobacter balticus]